VTAEPRAAGAEESHQEKIFSSGLSRSDTQRTKRPSGNLDGLFFQGRIVPTEVQKTIRTFWQKSYEGPKASVKEFLQNKHLCFQRLIKFDNIGIKMAKFVALVFRESPNFR
jgi:hypothetical protein